MDEEQIELVKSTWASVVPIADTAATIFYAKLFELDPSLRELFPEDLSAQKVKLMKTIGVAVDGLDNLEEIGPTIQALGVRHVGYGAKEEHYSTVGVALLATLEKGLGEAWTPKAKEAWTAVYGLLSRVMIDAARDAKVA